MTKQYLQNRCMSTELKNKDMRDIRRSEKVKAGLQYTEAKTIRTIPRFMVGWFILEIEVNKEAKVDHRSNTLPIDNHHEIWWIWIYLVSKPPRPYRATTARPRNNNKCALFYIIKWAILGFLRKYSTSWHARYTMMTEMVMLHVTSSIVEPWYHHLQKLWACKVVKKTPHFLIDMKNIVLDNEKTINMTAVIILVIPLIILNIGSL